MLCYAVILEFKRIAKNTNKNPFQVALLRIAPGLIWTDAGGYYTMVESDEG